MLKLADLNIRRCASCGRLYQRAPEKASCSRCEQAAVDAASPPAETGARSTASSAEALLQDQKERECLHCGAAVVEGSDFCLLCNVELFKALGDAASALTPRLGVQKPRGGLEAAMVFRTLLAQRRRTAANRFDFVAVRRVR